MAPGCFFRFPQGRSRLRLDMWKSWTADTPSEAGLCPLTPQNSTQRCLPFRAEVWNVYCRKFYVPRQWAPHSQVFSGCKLLLPWYRHLCYFLKCSASQESLNTHSNIIFLLLQKISSANCCVSPLCIKHGNSKQTHLTLQVIQCLSWWFR